MTLPRGHFTVKIRGADPADYFVPWFRCRSSPQPSWFAPRSFRHEPTKITLTTDRTYNTTTFR
ncbi:hypothetical protein GHT06_022630 [Daphnia sinensis]|uniref:Uncharacterized protein n=1 Tax=Daphnia sinensis TaxID=1820382 RepID=A0AAD5PNU0_9CRUS|nr:hypothetical protein GHT06_022630 [Daphnia sinensis]